MAPPQRNHSTLPLKDKVRIIDMIDKGSSHIMIARMFGIGKSTVGDIKRKKDKILKFVNLKKRDPGTRKTIRGSNHPILEKALYAWFLQQRRLHAPISGDMICEKALKFHRQITNSNSGFNASQGWLDNFKKRHGLRFSNMTDDDLSSDDANTETRRREVLTDEEIVHAAMCEDDEESVEVSFSKKVSPPREVGCFNSVSDCFWPVRISEASIILS